MFKGYEINGDRVQAFFVSPGGVGGRRRNQGSGGANRDFMAGLHAKNESGASAADVDKWESENADRYVAKRARPDTTAGADSSSGSWKAP